MSDKKTAIVTGASGGIGAGLVEAFLNLGYNVVATSLNTTQSLTASPSLVLVDGDIGKKSLRVGLGRLSWRSNAEPDFGPW